MKRKDAAFVENGTPEPGPAPGPAQPGAPVIERLPMPEPAGGWPADEFTGVDGRFVRDAFTGVRSRAPE